MIDETQNATSPELVFSAELPEFEAFAERAILLGFTIHLKHYRFHPVHTSDSPSCISHVELSIIPILDEPRERCGWSYGGLGDIRGETIADVVAQGRQLLDRYQSGENLTVAVQPRQGIPRQRLNLSDEERQRRSLQMKNYHEKKKQSLGTQQPLATATSDTGEQ
jgi:hypothetical protein